MSSSHSDLSRDLLVWQCTSLQGAEQHFPKKLRQCRMPGVGSRGGIRTQDRVSAGMCERKEPSETPWNGARRTSVLSMTNSYFRRMRFATKVLGPPCSHTRRASASQVPPSFLPLPLGSLRLLFPVPFPCSSKEWEY